MKEKSALERELEQRQKTIKTLQESFLTVQRTRSNLLADLKAQILDASRYNDLMQRQLIGAARYDNWTKHQLTVTTRYDDLVKTQLAIAARHDEVLKRQQRIFDFYNRRNISSIGSLEKIAALGSARYDNLGLAILENAKSIAPLKRSLEELAALKPITSPMTNYSPKAVEDSFASYRLATERAEELRTKIIAGSLFISQNSFIRAEGLRRSQLTSSTITEPTLDSSSEQRTRVEHLSVSKTTQQSHITLQIGTVEHLHVTLNSNAPINSLQIGNDNSVTNRNFSIEGDVACDLLILLHSARDTLHLLPEKFREQAREEIDNLEDELVHCRLYSDLVKDTIKLVARLLLTARENIELSYRILSLASKL